jgi:hypothetical protein
VSFRTRINLPCVNAKSGEVILCFSFLFPHCSDVRLFLVLVSCVCVQPQVARATLPILKAWQRNNKMEVHRSSLFSVSPSPTHQLDKDVLLAIKNLMLQPANKKLAQPADGANF